MADITVGAVSGHHPDRTTPADWLRASGNSFVLAHLTQQAEPLEAQNVCDEADRGFIGLVCVELVALAGGRDAIERRCILH
jgi:hypothetical protein